MKLAFIIGTTAATLTTLSLLPQVIKAHKTRRTQDLSLGMLVIFSVGLALWSVYGVLLREAPIIAANTVTLALVAYLLVLKIRHG